MDVLNPGLISPIPRISESAAGFSASPVPAAGRVYFTSEDADVFVIPAGRTFELATNPLGELAMTTQHHLIGLRSPALHPGQAGPDRVCALVTDGALCRARTTCIGTWPSTERLSWMLMKSAPRRVAQRRDGARLDLEPLPA